MKVNNLLTMLADEAHDWPSTKPHEGSVTVWFRPAAQQQPFDAQTIPPQPMYRLRKLIARAKGVRTSELPAQLLNALSDIERGHGSYCFAFESSADALVVAGFWRNDRLKRYPRARTLHEHKMDQLAELFPNVSDGMPTELTLFAGRGIAVHPGIGPHPGAGSIQSERPDLISRDEWDLAGWFRFFGRVWLVAVDETAQPLSLVHSQLQPIGLLPTDMTQVRSSDIRAFRSAVLQQLTSKNR